MIDCISTTTVSSFPLQVVVPVTGVLAVQDVNGNPYYDVSCLVATSSNTFASTTQVVDNPTLDYFLGVVLFMGMLFAMIYLFANKRRQ
jgi:hypothetical protein